VDIKLVRPEPRRGAIARPLGGIPQTVNGKKYTSCTDPRRCGVSGEGVGKSQRGMKGARSVRCGVLGIGAPYRGGNGWRYTRTSRKQKTRVKLEG